MWWIIWIIYEIQTIVQYPLKESYGKWKCPVIVEKNKKLNDKLKLKLKHCNTRHFSNLYCGHFRLIQSLWEIVWSVFIFILVKTSSTNCTGGQGKLKGLFVKTATGCIHEREEIWLEGGSSGQVWPHGRAERSTSLSEWIFHNYFNVTYVILLDLESCGLLSIKLLL